jgi:hypothetical protein
VNLNLRINNRTKTELELGKREGNILYCQSYFVLFFDSGVQRLLHCQECISVDLFVIVKFENICNEVYTFDFPITFRENHEKHGL